MLTKDGVESLGLRPPNVSQIDSFPPEHFVSSGISFNMLALENKKDTFVLDALPYVDDQEYNEQHRKFAMGLIEEEQRIFPKTKNYLRPFAKPNYNKFLTDRLTGEFMRMEQKTEMEKLDMTRYDIPSPLANTPQAKERAAWTKDIQNCEAQLESQNLRKINLELMTDYSSEAHLRMNTVLQRETEEQERSVYQLRSTLFELHSRRKRRQEETGEKLIQLGSQWVNLVNKNMKLDEAIHHLQDDIRAHKKTKEIQEFDFRNSESVS
ncbi:Pre-mRNA-splicing factor SPF27 [Aphelenchoides besseyi]|nr:Pre-mRNA-splicing factor SPF27 [Aphelenchoides besseyi]